MNKHLGSNERYQIQIGLAQNLPVSAIAQGIGYSKSTVYREITRNVGGAGYDAYFAQQRASRRAARSRNGLTIAQTTWHRVEHYLLYAINHGIAEPLARQLLSITLAVIVTSVVAHGISVTPLMKRYETRKKAKIAP